MSIEQDYMDTDDRSSVEEPQKPRFSFLLGKLETAYKHRKSVHGRGLVKHDHRKSTNISMRKKTPTKSQKRTFKQINAGVKQNPILNVVRTRTAEDHNRKDSASEVITLNVHAQQSRYDAKGERDISPRDRLSVRHSRVGNNDAVPSQKQDVSARPRRSVSQSRLRDVDGVYHTIEIPHEGVYEEIKEENENDIYSSADYAYEDTAVCSKRDRAPRSSCCRTFGLCLLCFMIAAPASAYTGWYFGTKFGNTWWNTTDVIGSLELTTNECVSCDEHDEFSCPWICKKDSDGWIVWLRRVDGKEQFNRSWTEYVNGFGSPRGNYWLGLDYLHKLTHNTKGVKLRLEIKYRNIGQEWAELNGFSVGGNNTQYALTLGQFTSGNKWNVTYNFNNVPFVTYDHGINKTGITEECIDAMGGGGWWFIKCNNSINPTGIYSIQERGFPFITWANVNNSVEEIKMMIK